MSEAEPAEELSTGFAEMIPENAKHFLEEAESWVRNNPKEAALISAGAGLVIGLTGVGRLYRGVNALRSMPLVSQFVIGVVAKGLLSKEFRGTEDAVH